MNFRIIPPLILLAFGQVSAQVSFTANDFVPPGYSPFGFGVNMGAYRGWTDQDLADIAAGNPQENVVGLGANTVRVWLPDWFTEEWGYQIRVDAFKHYENIGMSENVVFIGDASPKHRDTEMYCSNRQSESFLNLYEPIWDNGVNGTPVNEENYYAAYVYNLVINYGVQTKYWEITNEPDTDLGGNATAKPGTANNWWENDPPPCETKWGAPIQHYVRMMRIAYEVVKTLQPEDYITTGGIGNHSFLDAILRNTDNPDGGSVSPLYPYKGGAYFDCLSFHAYPHFDGSMRKWSNLIGGFQWTRNSDKGIEGYFSRMDWMVEILRNYGYDGETYPEKKIICTETNLSRNALTDNYLGTEESQRNYVIKVLAESQMRGLHQIHFYSLADNLPPAAANSDFDYMGFYKNLTDVKKPDREMLAAGTAFKTTATLLKGFDFDPDATSLLNLSAKVRGGAFRNKEGSQIFVLWATTLQDMTENAEIIYTFPKSFNFNELKKMDWDFSITGESECVSKGDVFLTGSPIFLIPDSSPEFSCEPSFSVKAMPNPFDTGFTIEIISDIDERVSIDLYDSKGALVVELARNRTIFIGREVVAFEDLFIKPGVYFLRIDGIGGSKVVKVIKG